MNFKHALFLLTVLLLAGFSISVTAQEQDSCSAVDEGMSEDFSEEISAYNEYEKWRTESYLETIQNLLPAQKKYLDRMDEALKKSLTPDKDIITIQNVILRCSEGESESNIAWYQETFALFQKEKEKERAALRKHFEQLRQDVDFIDQGILFNHIAQIMKVSIEAVVAEISPETENQTMSCPELKTLLSDYTLSGKMSLPPDTPETSRSGLDYDATP